MVQQGGVKALLALAAEGTPKGKLTAAHALARIAITINPEVSFPGQRVSSRVDFYFIFSLFYYFLVCFYFYFLFFYDHFFFSIIFSYYHYYFLFFTFLFYY